MIIIGDSSALILLAKINKLHFLDDLFTDIFVPESVFYEATKKDSKDSQVLSDYLADKIWTGNIVHKVKNPSAPRDQGEIDCINLCFTIEMDSSIHDEFQILIDDKIGKQLAASYDIACIGTITLLRKAIHKGLWSDYNDIQKAVTIIDESVRKRDGLRIPIKLLKSTLEDAMQDKNISKLTANNKPYSGGMKL